MGDCIFLIMFTLITLTFSLFFIGLTGWTISTYLVKENSQKFIEEELKNLFDICRRLFVSINTFIKVLVKFSFSPDSREANPSESIGFNEQPLKFVPPVKAAEVPVHEDEDNALSSFSPELIEVITEEEEKVA